MQKTYTLQSEIAAYGRTLWNNLVVGYLCQPLDRGQYKEHFTRITPPDQTNSGVCEFQYENSARIKVTRPNTITIEADTEDHLNSAGSDLVVICAGMGVPLVDSS